MLLDSIARIPFTGVSFACRGRVRFTERQLIVEADRFSILSAARLASRREDVDSTRPGGSDALRVRKKRAYEYISRSFRPLALENTRFNIARSRLSITRRTIVLAITISIYF